MSADREADKEPYIIAVCGDFGSRADASIDLAARRWRAIDVDNFDAVLQKFDVRWTPPQGDAANPPDELRLSSLDDFGPEAIGARLTPLRQLFDLRRDVHDPAGLERALRGLGLATPTPPPAAAPTHSRVVNPAQLLDQIISGESAPAPTLVGNEVDELVRKITAPHLLKGESETEAQLRAAIDARVSIQLDTTLHDAAFQRLESTWRGVNWLLRRTIGDEATRIRLLHLPKAALLRDVVGANSPEDSTFRRMLTEPAGTWGTGGPSLLLGLYEFGAEDHDVVLLHALGSIAESVRAPFITAAAPSLLGCRSFAALPTADALRQRWQEPTLSQWQSLRSLACARWLAIAAPRWLGRIPVTAEIEGLHYRESIGASHEAYLWVHPAWLVAAALARGHAQGHSANAIAREVQLIDGLPFHTFQAGGETEALPCGETWITDTQVKALAEGGIVPVVSYRRRDAIALPRLHSLAEPATPLAD